MASSFQTNMQPNPGFVKPSFGGQKPPKQQCNDGGCGTRYPGSAENGRCGPSPVPGIFRSGLVPTVLVACADDSVMVSGRAPTMEVSEHVLWQMLGQAELFTPRKPLRASGQLTGATLTLTADVDAATGDDPGQNYLFPAILVEVSTNDNVSAGVTEATITGTFADGQVWSQDIELNQGHVGVSRFIIISSRVEQGGTYPSLFNIQRDVILQQTGQTTNIAALSSGDTSFTTSAPMRGPHYSLKFEVTSGNVNTNYSIECMTKVGRFWNWLVGDMYAAIMNQGRPGSF